MNVSLNRQKNDQVISTTSTVTATSISSERAVGCIIFKLALQETSTTLAETMVHYVSVLQPYLHLVYENGQTTYL